MEKLRGRNVGFYHHAASPSPDRDHFMVLISMQFFRNNLLYFCNKFTG
jgi:hypothetical protein